MTPDISSLLAALSTRVGWQPGNAVTFFVEPAGAPQQWRKLAAASSLVGCTEAVWWC
jgi:hypothetical protein